MSQAQPVIHSIYSLPHKLPHYTRGVSVLSAHTPSDAALILRKIGISRGHVLDASVHLDHAAYHFLAWARSRIQYSQKLDESAMALWGRKWEITDYKVSAIGSDEFSEEQKVALRSLSMGIRSHQDIARAHSWAGGLRSAGISKMETAAWLVAQGALYPLVRGAMEMTAARLMKMAEMERSTVVGERLAHSEEVLLTMVRSASEDPSLVGKPSWAETSDFKLRLAKSEGYIVESKATDRAFDGCFEMYDGDALIGALLEKANRCPHTPLAQNLFKYLDANSCPKILEKKPPHLDYVGWSNALISVFEAQEQSALVSEEGQSMRAMSQRGG